MSGDLCAQALSMLADVHAILVDAYGGDLDGSERGKLVSSHYLARIRHRLRGHAPERPQPLCEPCIDLRRRLMNIYHLTLNGGEDAAIVRAVRAASGPGAPAPRAYHHPETLYDPARATPATVSELCLAAEWFDSDPLAGERCARFDIALDQWRAECRLGES